MYPLQGDALLRVKVAPSEIFNTQVYYLRHERNAWHSTWVARYGLARKKWRDFLISLDATGGPDGQTRETDIHR